LNNWLLFSTEIEILYQKLTGKTALFIDEYFKKVDSWYYGDGWYGDGPDFKMDYYNSLVIYPMLLDLCEMLPEVVGHESFEKVLRRAQRYAETLENLIAPDGTYIVTGRSSTYRCGVFHLLAQLTWQGRLPKSILPSTAREILYAVVKRVLSASSYRSDGFLNIGISRHQPERGENYITTGSLYLASVAFLPLGIASDSEFWSAPPTPWTQCIIWN
jgi:hypothetical protein